MTVLRLTAALVVCLATSVPAEAGLFDMFRCKHRTQACAEIPCGAEVSCCAPTHIIHEPAPNCCAPSHPVCHPQPSCCAPVVVHQPVCAPVGCGRYGGCGATVYHDDCGQCRPRECLTKRMIRAAWAAEYKKNSWFARKLNMPFPYAKCGEPAYHDHCGHCRPRECFPKRMIRAAWAAEYSKNSWFARKLNMDFPYTRHGY